VVWNKTGTPTLENNSGKTTDGSGTRSFISELTELEEGTEYFVRAYAINGEGIKYGNEIKFRTLEEQLPVVTTFTPQDIIPGAATLGGEITATGTSEIIERGVCWATNPSPTIEDNKAVFYLFGSDGIESFSREITGFLTNTTYYVRAYAVNSNGIAYGQEENWTTSFEIALPTVTTNEPEDITTNSAVLGGHVNNTGGTFVTEWGIVYGTSLNPTVDDNKFVIQNTDINGVSGSIGITVNELNAGTNYYVRAYAINSKGTGYGEQKSFTTEQVFNGETGTFTDIRDGNEYKWVKIGEQIWMAENLGATKYNDGSIIPLITEQGEIGGSTGWRNLTYGAYCWYNNNESIYEIKNTPLYNWFAVESGKLCPNGWHVPTDTDWNILSEFLGGQNLAGGKMKMTTGWDDPNVGATNSSGFSALPGGSRDGRGVFLDMRSFAGWWSSTEQSSTLSWGWSVSSCYEKLMRHYHDKVDGKSIRCVKSD
jgi:uncharacterized protein (TIGR02145 family)